MVWIRARPGITVFPPVSRENCCFPLYTLMWNYLDNYHFSCGGQCHWHANGWSFTIICHWNKLFQWLFQCVLHHRNAIWWKCHIASTILVLSLWQLGKGFPSCMCHLYHSTPAYSTYHSSRLIVIYCSTVVPNPRGTWYDSTVPSVIGCRHRHKYQETIATRQWPILVVPGNYLHAGMIPSCSSIGTMIRSQGFPVARLALAS